MAFSIPGLWTWTGLATFSGGVSTNSIVAASGDLTLQATAAKVFLTGQGKVNINSIADAIEMSCPFGTLREQGLSVDIDVVTGSVQPILLGFVNATEIDIGHFGGCNVYVRCEDFQLEADGPRFDCRVAGLNPVRIANSNATQLVVGNAACSWTTSGTAWAASYSGIVDLASTQEIILEVNSGPNSVEIDMSNVGILNILASAQLALGALVIDINTAGTNPVNISNVTGLGSIALNAATITAVNLPVDIGGSVAVMWNAGTGQFYHA